jgi:hypothetical protein
MGFKAIEPVEITGLTANTNWESGWNNNINLTSYTTIPAPATAVLFTLVNDSGSSEIVGIRHQNNTSNVYAVTFGGGRFGQVVATLEGSSNSVFSFIKAVAGVKIFLSGFFHDLTVFEPQNRISSSTSTNNWQTKTIPELPTGTTYILNSTTTSSTLPNYVWREFGGTVEYPMHGALTFIKVDANKRFEVNTGTSGIVEIWGYTDKNWIQLNASNTGNSISNTSWSANSNWNDFPYSYPNKTGVLVVPDDDGISGYTSSQSYFFRKKGGAWTIARSGQAIASGAIVEPDANGTFQYWLESGVAGNTGSLYVTTTFTETVPDYTLTDVNTTESVSAGESGVVFTGRGLSSVNKIRITSNTKFVNANVTSANSTTVIAPIPTDSDFFSSNVAFGNVTFSVEIAGNAVANLAGTLSLSQDWNQHDIINVSQNTNSNTVYFSQSPPLSVGDKIALATKTSTYQWDSSIEANGFISLTTSYSTESDNLSYRIYYSQFEQWTTPGTITISSPYVNALANTVRAKKSVDRLVYSRYPAGTPALGWIAQQGISAGQTLTIFTDGTYNFGSTGPSVVIYDDFSGGTVSANVELGNWSNVNNSQATYAPGGRDGSTAMKVYGSGKGNTLTGAAIHQGFKKDFTDATEVFIQYSIYTGTDVGGLTPNTWPTTSFWKKAWFTDAKTNPGTEGLSNGDGNDIVLVTRVGSDVTVVGNDTLAGNTAYLSNLAPIINDQWDFTGWNTFGVWVKGDTTSPAVNPSTIYAQFVNKNTNSAETVSNKIMFNPAYASRLNRAFVPGWFGNFPSGFSDALDWKYDDVYIAAGAGAAARVLLGDASTWSSCRNVWIAPPTSWSSNKITCEIPKTLSGINGLYAYIFNSSNQLVNSSGLSIS